MQRHEQAFYSFVYKVHTKGEALFDSLVKWAEIFISFMSSGIGDEISLEYLLPHSNEARTSIFNEVDAVALYHYRLKVAHEEQVRRRFGGQAKDEIAVAEEAAAQDLVDSVIGQMNIGDLVQGDAVEIGEDSSDEYTSSDEDDSSAGTHEDAERPDATAGPSARTPSSRRSSASGKSPSRPTLHKKLEELHLRTSSNASKGKADVSPQQRTKKGGPRYHEPELKAIPELLPIFLELVCPIHFDLERAFVLRTRSHRYDPGYRLGRRQLSTDSGCLETVNECYLEGPCY